MLFLMLIMKGDAMKRNLDELKKRANKRSISFSSKPKSENDIKVENDFFKTVENQIYKQIVRN